MFEKRTFFTWLATVLLVVLILIVLKAWISPDRDENQNDDSSNTNQATRLRATPSRVIDGDTIVCVLDARQVRIRLYGIDAPETTQDFGREAREFVKRTLLGATVHVEEVAIDRYGRSVAKVWLDDGTLLNELIISSGFAWWYRRYAPQDVELSDAEQVAQSQGIGLWSKPDPVPPWEFRRRKRSSMSSYLNP